jgi:hypothetical protein
MSVTPTTIDVASVARAIEAAHENDLGWFDVAEVAVRILVERGWSPHYYSTYCWHENHEVCRLTCKTCGLSCLCSCHHEKESRS